MKDSIQKLWLKDNNNNLVVKIIQVEHGIINDIVFLWVWKIVRELSHSNCDEPRLSLNTSCC